jgi:hypothetical protein
MLLDNIVNRKHEKCNINKNKQNIPVYTPKMGGVIYTKKFALHIKHFFRN